MSREVRMIIFSNEEMQTALSEGDTRPGESMPRGRIENIEVHDREVGVIIHYRPRAYADIKEWRVSHAQAAAALIRFCLNQGIPLPRAAKKTLFRDDRGIVLQFELDRREAPGAANPSSAVIWTTSGRRSSQ